MKLKGFSCGASDLHFTLSWTDSCQRRTITVCCKSHTHRKKTFLFLPLKHDQCVRLLIMRWRDVYDHIRALSLHTAVCPHPIASKQCGGFNIEMNLRSLKTHAESSVPFCFTQKSFLSLHGCGSAQSGIFYQSPTDSGGLSLSAAFGGTVFDVPRRSVLWWSPGWQSLMDCDTFPFSGPGVTSSEAPHPPALWPRVYFSTTETAQLWSTRAWLLLSVFALCSHTSDVLLKRDLSVLDNRFSR